MNFDPKKHHRRSIRLRHYDYSQAGIYFVTICTYKRQCWFGEIKNGQMHLNHIGKIVADEWLRTSEIRPNFQLDEWIIMPNHLHGIVIIQDISNGNIQDVGNQNIQGVDNKNIQGVDNKNIQGVGNKNIQSVGNENIQGVGNGKIQGVGNGKIQGARNAPLRQKPNSLSSFIAGFKSAVSKRVNLLRHSHDIPIWQRNYYESIIRDEKSLVAVQEYIINNPSRWKNDPDNLQNYQNLEELSLDLFF
ncbi:MAG: transposase [Nostocaceae cyanobacterium]|nr:transposase [Nostocaceae cyanobacterium]